MLTPPYALKTPEHIAADINIKREAFMSPIPRSYEIVFKHDPPISKTGNMIISKKTATQCSIAKPRIATL